MSLSLFDEDPQAGTFRILTVCTGNICRSPLAESLLRMVLRGLLVEVSSAGTHAHVGEQMSLPNQAIARDLGVTDAGMHRGAQLTTEALSNADLILALSREHRREVVEMLPRASRHAFTLREFARLTNAVSVDADVTASLTDPGARMRAFVNAVAQLRGTAEPLERPEDDDVIDPYRQSDAVYTESAEQLVPAVNATAAELRRVAGSRG